jgi:Carboxypeptidase regulatory-like domain
MRVDVLTVLALCASVLSQATPQRPARDTARSSSVGTAVIAGTVVTDDKDRRPLRRARVLLTNSDHDNGRTVITDDAGRFSFVDLSPDRYLLTAKKAGYVPMEYGAKRSTRPGSAIVLEEGQRLTNLVLRLPRGAVITGAIVDQSGQPVSGASVTPIRYQFAENGRRTLTRPGSDAQTNDLGQYRIWGLDAGEYVVAASMPEISQPDLPDLVRLTDADIKQAEADVSGVTTRGTPSLSRRADYAPVYYPGTFAASEAASVRLAAGEERSAIDFQLSLISTAEVEGTVAFPDGVDRNLSVQMVRSDADGVQQSTMSAHVGDDSHFSFSGVPPGQYRLIARAEAGPPPSATGGVVAFSAFATAHWALTDVTVSGEDVSGISLVLQPAFRVSGKVQVKGSGSPPDLSRLIVMLAPEQPSGYEHFGATPAPVDANGAFTILGVTPGSYWVRAVNWSLRNADDIWQVKSAVVNGRETVDEPIELRTSVEGVILTLTDRMPGLSGVVRDASGRAPTDCRVVVFAKDRKFWLPESSRVGSVRPASDGSYVIRSVPAGDYLVTAVSDLDPGEWFDPSVLEQLSKSALTITLTEGEKRTQDLRLVERR